MCRSDVNVAESTTGRERHLPVDFVATDGGLHLVSNGGHLALTTLVFRVAGRDRLTLVLQGRAHTGGLVRRPRSWLGKESGEGLVVLVVRQRRTVAPVSRVPARLPNR